MSNSHNRKLQAQQLEFESRERQRERQVSLRKDVYLAAAEATTGIVHAFSRMLGSDGPESSDNLIKNAEAYGAALARVQMVASAETIRHSGEFQRTLLNGIAAVQKLRYPMMLRKADIDIAINGRERHHAERLKCIELMKEYNRAGDSDVQRWKTIQRQSDYAAEHWAEAHSESMRLMLQQETDRHALLHELAARLIDLSKAQAPLASAIRRELEVSDDTALIVEETEKTGTAAVSAIMSLLPVIEATMEDLRRDVEADEQGRRQQQAIAVGKN